MEGPCDRYLFVAILQRKKENSGNFYMGETFLIGIHGKESLFYSQVGWKLLQMDPTAFQSSLSHMSLITEKQS